MKPMSEAASPPPPPATGASLYPADGGAAAAAATSTLPAGSGTDTVAAGTGADTVVAGTGTDTVVAGAGTDTVAAGTGTDTLAAGTGEDTVAAGQAGDTITAASYDFKLPEGFIGDDALTTAAKDTFAAAGVPPDKAQGLVDLFGKAMKASADAQVAAHNTQQNTWLTEINSMPEFTGPTRETSLASIGKLFDEFGTPEAKAALNSYGVGNNPALVRMMLKIASTVSEGGPTGQGRPTGTGGKMQAKAGTPGSLYDNDGRGPVKQ
jgi:hypothetical protein